MFITLSISLIRKWSNTPMYSQFHFIGPLLSLIMHIYWKHLLTEGICNFLQKFWPNRSDKTIGNTYEYRKNRRWFQVSQKLYHKQRKTVLLWKMFQSIVGQDSTAQDLKTLDILALWIGAAASRGQQPTTSRKSILLLQTINFLISRSLFGLKKNTSFQDKIVTIATHVQLCFTSPNSQISVSYCFVRWLEVRVHNLELLIITGSAFTLTEFQQKSFSENFQNRGNDYVLFQNLWN